MSQLLVIGCVQVVISKICQDSEDLQRWLLRTKSKWWLESQTGRQTSTKIETAAWCRQVEEVMIESYKPEAVWIVALPYQDLTIADACLGAPVFTIDTANHEAKTQKTEWRENVVRTWFYCFTWLLMAVGLIREIQRSRLDCFLGPGFDLRCN